MPPLRAARRRRLPRSSFAYPRTRSYPIDTVRRARNALARAAQPQTKGSYAHVARAVRRKWGNRVATVGRKRGTVSAPGYRKTRRSSGGTRRRRTSASTGRRSTSRARAKR
jgi:hypothetical protein